MGWPFSLPKALYSRGFLRKAADFESRPSVLSSPGFLSDLAVPLCFREAEHEVKSGGPQPNKICNQQVRRGQIGGLDGMNCYPEETTTVDQLDIPGQYGVEYMANTIRLQNM